MSYKKLNLSNGTVLDQSHLAHFEEGIANAVCYDSAQPGLTEEQKAQARANIGADVILHGGVTDNMSYIYLYTKDYSKVLSSLGFKIVRYDAEQDGLNEREKAQARANIGAASVEEVLAELPVYAGEVEAV